MSDAFDPYLKWFGIPPAARPINHYRLLGIEVFETDPEVIENATDQRMAHLKRFSAGQHATLAEQLLNEVAAARVCLLNPGKKAKYDEELRLRLAVAPLGRVGFAVPPGHLRRESGSSASRAPPRPQFDLPGGRAAAHARQPPLKRGVPSNRSRSAGWLAMLAGLVALAAVVALMLPMMANNRPREVASGEGGPASPMQTEASPKPTPAAVPPPTSSGRRRNRLRRRWTRR